MPILIWLCPIFWYSGSAVAAGHTSFGQSVTKRLLQIRRIKTHHHAVRECLLKFVGTHKREVRTVCKSDCVKEVLRAIRELGWLPESSLPRRWPRDSVFERQMKSFEEACRSLHLQAGFALVPALWPHTCQYSAIALSTQSWDKAFGKRNV